MSITPTDDTVVEGTETIKLTLFNPSGVTFPGGGATYTMTLNLDGNDTVGSTTEVYRFFNGSVGGHFFTASLAERAFVDSTLAAAFTFEGVKFWTYAADYGG